ncbi:MAG: hypothetical protein Aurels2KO_04600 [Aureliella sp.]
MLEFCATAGGSVVVARSKLAAMGKVAMSIRPMPRIATLEIVFVADEAVIGRVHV